VSTATQGFVRLRLDGASVPADLQALLSACGERPDFATNADNPLAHLGADLLWAGKSHSLLDHDYLNDLDKADPDIMANVAAMRDTAENLKFVLAGEDDALLGYWVTNADTPLDQCALFWLTSEGQYEIAEGPTLASTLAYRAMISGDGERCNQIRQAFAKLGVLIPEVKNDDDVFAGMDARQSQAGQTPQDYRDQRVRHHRSGDNRDG